MIIHKEGHKTIVFSIFIFSIILVVTEFFCPVFTIWHSFFYALLGVLLIIIILFFRYPYRQLVVNEQMVLCPCDGKVCVIEEVEETEFLHTKCLQVSIFMSPLNVHANWYPIGGVVEYFKYHAGKYLVAFHPKSSLLNERTTVVLATTNHKILVRQIAGALARRIVCYAEENNKINQGDQMGFIKFGSRVDLYLPLNSEIKVKLNQKVKGQLTTIALLN